MRIPPSTTARLSLPTLHENPPQQPLRHGLRDTFEQAPARSRAFTAQKPGTPALPELKDHLDNTEAGRVALAIFEAHGVEVVYGEPGGGTYYDKANNRVVVDPSQSPEYNALTLIHEAEHVETQSYPSATKMGREEYVKAALDEEAKACVETIEAKHSLPHDEQRKLPVMPGEAEYTAAYWKAHAEAIANGATEEQANAAGMAAGRVAVREWIETAKTSNSNPRVSYPDYYGKYWDEVHPKKKGAA